MKRYILSPEAKQDLADIKKYITTEAGTRIAKSTLAKIREAIAFVGEMPGAGHLREDLTDTGLKFWSVYSYLIIYNPNTKPVEIARIVHGSREVSALLPREN